MKILQFLVTIMMVIFGFSTSVFASETNLITESFFFNSGVNIPDGYHGGITDRQQVTSKIEKIKSITVHLKIEGQQYASNGDLWVGLSHGTNLVSLLNVVGSRLQERMGYPDNGFDVILDDTAVNGDIHVYRKTLFGNHETPIDPDYMTPLKGTWAPDGRGSAYNKVLDTDPRETFLSDFNGKDPNGIWTLVLADHLLGGSAKLVEWSITISGYERSLPVTEPVTPKIRILFEEDGGVEKVRFFVTGAKPHGNYFLQGTKDLKEWKEALPGIVIGNRDPDFEMSIPKLMLGDNTMFRLTEL